MKHLRLLCMLVLCAPLVGLGDEADPVLTFEATDTERINEAIGQTAAVTGEVTECFWVKDKVLMIIFQEDRSAFIAVSFAKHREALDQALDGDAVAALKGKRITVTGKLTEHRERPQIVVESSDQITFPQAASKATSKVFF